MTAKLEQRYPGLWFFLSNCLKDRHHAPIRVVSVSDEFILDVFFSETDATTARQCKIEGRKYLGEYIRFNTGKLSEGARSQAAHSCIEGKTEFTVLMCKNGVGEVQSYTLDDIREIVRLKMIIVS